jgi:hypothetical protein
MPAAKSSLASASCWIDPMPLIGIGTGRGLLYNPPVVVSAVTTTWNPSDKNAFITLSGGNLVASSNTGGDAGARSIASASTGKKYWENTATALVSTGGDYSLGGIANSTWNLTFMGASGSSGRVGNVSAGQTLCCAVDIDARKFWYRVNGGSWGPSGDPAAGTGGTDVSGVTGALFAAVFMKAIGDSFTANFGATAYSQTPPSGFGNW